MGWGKLSLPPSLLSAPPWYRLSSNCRMFLLKRALWSFSYGVRGRYVCRHIVVLVGNNDVFDVPVYGFCIRWASCNRFVDFDAIVMEFNLGFSMALNQGFKLTKKAP